MPVLDEGNKMIAGHDYMDLSGEGCRAVLPF